MELEIVKEEIKDEVIKNILLINSNQSCFDCGNKRPRWSSPYLGIFICMECAGRHRSYGTHISFVKSVDLDKWNKKQLKSLELTGNFYMKKQFEKYKVPKIGSIYDYNNELILKIRKHIEHLVKENLKSEDYSSLEQIKKSENNIIRNNELVNNININDNNEKAEKKFKPVAFITKKHDSSIKKGNKTNKIKKLNIDFDFDNYKEKINNKTQKEKENNVDPNKIKGMKLSKVDKKKELIKEKNQIKNDKSNCHKIRELIYYILCCFRK